MIFMGRLYRQLYIRILNLSLFHEIQELRDEHIIFSRRLRESAESLSARYICSYLIRMTERESEEDEKKKRRHLTGKLMTH